MQFVYVLAGACRSFAPERGFERDPAVGARVEPGGERLVRRAPRSDRRRAPLASSARRASRRGSPGRGRAIRWAARPLRADVASTRRHVQAPSAVAALRPLRARAAPRRCKRLSRRRAISHMLGQRRAAFVLPAGGSSRARRGTSGEAALTLGRVLSMQSYETIRPAPAGRPCPRRLGSLSTIYSRRGCASCSTATEPGARRRGHRAKANRRRSCARIVPMSRSSTLSALGKLADVRELSIALSVDPTGPARRRAIDGRVCAAARVRRERVSRERHAGARCAQRDPPRLARSAGDASLAWSAMAQRPPAGAADAARGRGAPAAAAATHQRADRLGAAGSASRRCAPTHATSTASSASPRAPSSPPRAFSIAASQHATSLAWPGSAWGLAVRVRAADTTRAAAEAAVG